MPASRLAIIVSLGTIPLPAQAAWSMLYPTPPMQQRIAAAMAGLDSTGQVVLFGGRGMSGQLADAWILQSASWSPMVGALPPAREDAALVCDSLRNRLVLFGGGDAGGNALGDLWEWDGATWSQGTTANGPSARREHAMAFDPERGVTVLYGGFRPNQVNAYQSDVWEWNGTTWVQRALSAPPGMRADHAMAFDPGRREVLLFGGFVNANVYAYLNDTWSWNGTSWHLLFPATPPAPRAFHRMVTDLARQRVVMHGGQGADSFAWEWDGNQWNLMLQASPAGRWEAGMAYDAIGRRVVVFGGSYPVGQGNTFLNDTWVYATSSPASVTAYGSGCAGSNGMPDLAAAPYSLPWLGDSHHDRVSNLAATSGGVFFATGFGSTPPLPLGAYGMPGCSQLLVPAVVEFMPAFNGLADWPLTIPNSIALANTQLWQQAFALDSAANQLGLTASNGVVLSIGVR